MKKVALITGITGQDGSYLAELLLNKGYEVHGIVRRVALEDETHRLWRIRGILKDINIHAGSLESYASIFNIILRIKPIEVYHLAAQSYVGYSFEDEFSTLNININGTHYLLSAVKEFANRKIKFYFAGSSEMFGKVKAIHQNENTVSSLKQYKNEVENKEFPTESHSYKAGEDIEKMLKSWKKELKKIKLS